MKTSKAGTPQSNNTPEAAASPARFSEPPPNAREHLAREINEITALYNIGVAVGSSLNLKEVLWSLYKESSRLVDTSNFTIALYDDDTRTLNFVLVFQHGQRVRPFSVRLNAHQGLSRQILTGGTPLLIPNLPQDPAAQNSLEAARFRSDRPLCSWLGVPILNPAVPGEKALGVIALWSYTPHAFTEHDLWLLSAIGTQAAIAIRNARLYENSQRRATEMAFLNDVARTLSSTLHLEEVLTRIMEEVERMLNAEAGSLLLTDPATGDLVFQIALGAKADEIKPFRVPKGQGIAGEVALTGKPLLVNNVAKDKRHFKKLARAIDFQTRNILCVPLVLYDNVIGVLQVLNKKGGDFTPTDLKLLESIASYAAIAIQNARLHEDVLAERDRVIAAEQEARKQLARDLHDGPTQLVAGIMMSLDFCKKALQKDPSLLDKELGYMQELAERAGHQMRTLLFELRPLVLETQGIGEALKVFLERRQKDIEKSTKLTLKINTDNPGGDISRQDGKIEAAIFSVVQETVNNAIKHAKAKNIVVELNETADGVYTIVSDDGQGFDVDQVMANYEQRGSMGMVNLKERSQLIGGELSIESTPGRGTRFTLYVPKEEALRLKKRGGTGPLSIPLEGLPKL